MRVLVTGASGFIGGHLCRLLVAQGYAVRALVLDAEDLPDAELTCFRGFEDTDGLDRAMRGVDAVVHLAARAHVMDEATRDPTAEYRRVNTEGARTVAEAASRAGVRAFVFISSVKAVGDATDVPWTRATPAGPTDPYGLSKLEAEYTIAGIAAASGMLATTIRFPLVFGPGMRANMLRLFDTVNAGYPIPIGTTGRRSLIFVGNATAAIETVLRSPERAAGTWFVADRPDLQTVDLVRAIAAALNRPARVLKMPRQLLTAVGWLGDLVPSATRCPINSQVVRRLCESLVVDSDEFCSATGYRAPYTVAQGIALTADWYRQLRA